MDDFIYGEPRAVPPPPLTLNLKAKSNQAVEGHVQQVKVFELVDFAEVEIGRRCRNQPI